MADIAADIAWMRQHADRQAQLNYARAVHQAEEERQRELQTCAYCFHDTHADEIGSWEFDVGGPIVQHGPTSTRVYWCKDDSCICGIEPCGNCGTRSRRTIENRSTSHYISYVERCGCGAEWAAAMYA